MSCIECVRRRILNNRAILRILKSLESRQFSFKNGVEEQGHVDHQIRIRGDLCNGMIAVVDVHVNLRKRLEVVHK